MIELTLVDALRYNVENYDKHFLYLVREGETVFYVGRSLDPIGRLQEHLYGGRSGKIDRLGNFTRCYVKQADDWRFQMLTIEECMPFIHRPQMQILTAEEWQKAITQENILDKALQKSAITLAELALIAHYRPCLNVANNPSPSPLPGKYRLDAAMLGIQ